MKTIFDIQDALGKERISFTVNGLERTVFIPRESGEGDLLVTETPKPNLFNVYRNDDCLLREKPLEDVIKLIEISVPYTEDELNLTTEMTDTQEKIVEILDGMKDLLLYKNQKYGDSAINPKKVFYKGDATNSILIRLDDKLGRIMANPDEKPRTNDVADLIGYCTLLLISMGVTPEDIANFKD